jgi:hypothetical protein
MFINVVSLINELIITNYDYDESIYKIIFILLQNIHIHIQKPFE